MAWRVGCGAVASFISGGFIPGPPGLFLVLRGFRSARHAGGSAVPFYFRHLKGNLRKWALPGRHFSGLRPLLGLRRGACGLKGRGLRSGHWSGGAPGIPCAGLVWSPFALGSWFWCAVCVRLSVGGAGVTRCGVGRWRLYGGRARSRGLYACGVPVAVASLVAAEKWRNLSSSGRLGGSRCAFCWSLALCGASGEEPPHRTRARRGAQAPL